MNTPSPHSKSPIVLTECWVEGGRIHGQLIINKTLRQFSITSLDGIETKDLDHRTVEEIFQRRLADLVEPERPSSTLTQIEVQITYLPQDTRRLKKGKKTLYQDHILEKTEKGEKKRITIYEQKISTLPSKAMTKKILERSLGAIETEGARKYVEELVDDKNWDRITHRDSPYGGGGEDLVQTGAYRALLKEQYGRSSTAFEEINRGYLPALVNFWRHEVQAGHEVRAELAKKSPQARSILRHGAIYDQRCAVVSTNYLEKIAQALEKGDDKELKKVQKAVKEQIDKIYEEGSDAFEIAQAQLPFRFIAKFLESKELLLQAIEERKLIEEAQFLTLLSEHLAGNKRSDRFQGDRFSVGQVSLLRAKKADLKKGPHPMLSKSKDQELGWSHVEPNEIEDMYELFYRMDGSIMVFDLAEGEAPYIEKSPMRNKGVIHLPVSLGDVAGQEIALRAHFINIDVHAGIAAGDVDPEFIVEHISVELLKEMVKDPQGKVLLEQIENGYISYDLAADVLRWMEQRGYNLGVNCQSGKDRTGVVCDEYAERVMLDQAPKIHQGVSEQKEALENEVSTFKTDLAHYEARRETHEKAEPPEGDSTREAWMEERDKLDQEDATIHQRGKKLKAQCDRFRDFAARLQIDFNPGGEKRLVTKTRKMLRRLPVYDDRHIALDLIKESLPDGKLIYLPTQKRGFRPSAWLYLLTNFFSSKEV